jgi:hypothetical protein
MVTSSSHPAERLASATELAEALQRVSAALRWD